MDIEQLIERVRKRGPSNNPDGAPAATISTTKLLARQLSKQEARNLAEQLPKTLADPVESEGGQAKQVASIEAFYEALAAEAELSMEDARAYGQAALSVLSDAVTDGEIADVRLDLPPHLTDLLPYTSEAINNLSA